MKLIFLIFNGGAIMELISTLISTFKQASQAKELISPSFELKNMRLNPQELKENSKALGISGDAQEINRFKVEDTLTQRIKEAFPTLCEVVINKMKGNIAERLMDEYFKNNGGWKKMEGEVGVNGIDGLYVKIKKGVITDVLICDSKYGNSRLGDTKDGKQMSRDWIVSKLETLEKAYPDNKYYSQIKKKVEQGNYRARLFQMKESEGQLDITLKTIDSDGRNINMKDNKYYKINKIPKIDLDNPRNSFEEKIIESYKNIYTNEIKAYKQEQKAQGAA